MPNLPCEAVLQAFSVKSVDRLTQLVSDTSQYLYDATTAELDAMAKIDAVIPVEGIPVPVKVDSSLDSEFMKARSEKKLGKLSQVEWYRLFEKKLSARAFQSFDNCVNKAFELQFNSFGEGQYGLRMKIDESRYPFIGVDFKWRGQYSTNKCIIMTTQIRRLNALMLKSDASDRLLSNDESTLSLEFQVEDTAAPTTLIIPTSEGDKPVRLGARSGVRSGENILLIVGMSAETDDSSQITSERLHSTLQIRVDSLSVGENELEGVVYNFPFRSDRYIPFLPLDRYGDDKLVRGMVRATAMTTDQSWLDHVISCSLTLEFAVGRKIEETDSEGFKSSSVRASRLMVPCKVRLSNPNHSPVRYAHRPHQLTTGSSEFTYPDWI